MFAVFYDQTILPYTTEESSQLYAGSGTIDLQIFKVEGIEPSEWRDDVVLWDNAHDVLFRNRIFLRLSKPVDSDGRLTDTLLDLTPTKDVELFARAPHRIKGGKYVWIKQDLALHWLRADIDVPEVFYGRRHISPRSLFVAAEALAAFSYVLPGLSPLTPEQLMYVREIVADTREGFAMHLQALSKALNQAESANLNEVLKEGASIVETGLVPDYFAFRRQLGSKKKGWWRRVLNPAVELLQIDAAPWTPKFFGQIAKAIGVPGFASQPVQSNAEMAYHFMRTVEHSGELGVNAPRVYAPGGPVFEGAPPKRVR
jgi:hypothetical protein